MKKDLREFIKALRGLRMEVVTRRLTGKSHYQLTIRSPEAARDLVYTMPSSGSDHRGAANRLQDVKRYFGEQNEKA